MVTLNNVLASFHSIKISNGTYDLAIDSNGYLTIANSSFAVTATNLDIRDLDYSTDNVQIKSAAGVALAVDGSGFLTITNSSFAVTATNLDIRDLTHVSDSVKIGDGTDFLAVNGDGSINVQTVPGGFASWKVTDQDVTSTASELAATPLTGRLSLEVQNVGSVDVYVNFSNAVTTANGLMIPKGSSWAVDLDDTANIWAITSSGTADLRIVELAA